MARMSEQVERIKRQQIKRRADQERFGVHYLVGTICLDEIDYLLAEVERLNKRRILTRPETPEESAKWKAGAAPNEIRGACLIVEIVDGDDPRLRKREPQP